MSGYYAHHRETIARILGDIDNEDAIDSDNLNKIDTDEVNSAIFHLQEACCALLRSERIEPPTEGQEGGVMEDEFEGLPAVGGDLCERSLGDLQRASLVLIMHERAKIAPDNALISVLCDTVRLCREDRFADAVKEESQSDLAALRARCEAVEAERDALKAVRCDGCGWEYHSSWRQLAPTSSDIAPVFALGDWVLRCIIVYPAHLGAEAAWMIERSDRKPVESNGAKGLFLAYFDATPEAPLDKSRGIIEAFEATGNARGWKQ